MAQHQGRRQLHWWRCLALYSVLPVTGGKVGAANVWRKSLDDTLGYAWNALAAMRRTSQPQLLGRSPASHRRSSHGHSAQPGPSASGGAHTVRYAARTGLTTCDCSCRSTRAILLSDAEVHAGREGCRRARRPISAGNGAGGHSLDLGSSMRTVESLSASAHRHLLPYLPQLVSHLAFHIEQQRTPSERLAFLKATYALLAACPHLHDTITASRLARAIAPALTILLATKTQGQQDAGTNASRTKNRKGKKRARGYEGDEVFNVAADVICTSKTDGDVLLASIDVVRLVLRNPQLPPAVHSLCAGSLGHLRLPAPDPAYTRIAGSLLAWGDIRKDPRCMHRASIRHQQRVEQEPRACRLKHVHRPARIRRRGHIA
ncbi:uncharacterized protein B0H18DRAFT_12189 [Fomitopsis serialis]|uniref:uncharacterized protein n=1 Tax=Fomitopsis serialis TaxID=139415 RepID=UPI0020072E76|nr:uncharacterized protein B0H18DRAFT_12189 [Neoantrodia serialis]KAH9938362.1 hypothetical protein B0H18DRAFT_12189 [Neoantrodia serialis]